MGIKKLLGIGFLAVGTLLSAAEKEMTVNMYMWGGSKEINKYMDTIVAEGLKKDKNIVLNRVPIGDIKDTVNKLLVEKYAGKKKGTVDILWINGENFKTLKEGSVLMGSFTDKLSNIGKVKSATLVSDFGTPVEGMEAPWGEAQFNFIYDGSKYSEKPFLDNVTLMEFVKKNPGRFTYPSVSGFTGSAFVRNMAVDIIGDEKIRNMSNEELKKELNTVWNYFNEMKPYLWREGSTYPESEGMIDTLYSRGEVDVTMGYTPNKVNSKINAKEYPATSKSFLLDKGTLFNNHYLSIPFNSQNKEAAMEVIDYLISEEMQYEKQKPENWGDFTVLDIEKVSDDYKKKFQNLVESDNLPTLQEMNQKRVGELPSDKVAIIDEGWVENVAKTK